MWRKYEKRRYAYEYNHVVMHQYDGYYSTKYDIRMFDYKINHFNVTNNSSVVADAELFP
jgi:hypothetical protein